MTTYHIEAIIVTPLEVEHAGRWIIKAQTQEDACRCLIGRLGTNGCHVAYYTRISQRSLKP